MNLLKMIQMSRSNLHFYKLEIATIFGQVKGLDSG